MFKGVVRSALSFRVLPRRARFLTSSSVESDGSSLCCRTGSIEVSVDASGANIARKERCKGKGGQSESFDVGKWGGWLSHLLYGSIHSYFMSHLSFDIPMSTSRMQGSMANAVGDSQRTGPHASSSKNSKGIQAGCDPCAEAASTTLQ